MSRLTAVCVALLLTGPVASRGESYSASQVQVDYGTTETSVEFFGPPKEWGATIGVVRENSAFLRSWVDKKTHALLRHQIYFVRHYDAREFENWNAAAFDDGNRAIVTAIASGRCAEKVTCVHHEQVGIEVSDGKLRASRRIGLRVKASAQSGRNLTIDIPSLLIEAQLSAIHAEFGAVAP